LSAMTKVTVELQLHSCKKMKNRYIAVLSNQHFCPIDRVNNAMSIMSPT